MICTDGLMLTVFIAGICIGMFVGLTLVAVIRSLDFKRSTGRNAP